MNKTYQSDLLRVCHEMMADLYKDGQIDEACMGEFDADCLVPDAPLRGPAARRASRAMSNRCPE
jgi:hypothetical protein